MQRLECRIWEFCSAPKGHHSTKTHVNDARPDLSSTTNVLIRSGEVQKVPIGLQMAIPVGYYGSIAGRSGLALKCVSVLGGIIDSEYRGEVAVILHNAGQNGILVHVGQAIAQLNVLPNAAVRAVSVEALSHTERDENGS